MDTSTKTQATATTSRSELPPKMKAMFDWIEAEPITFQQFIERVNNPKVAFSDKDICFLNFALDTTSSVIRHKSDLQGIPVQSGAAAVIVLYPYEFRRVTEALYPLFDF